MASKRTHDDISEDDKHLSSEEIINIVTTISKFKGKEKDKQREFANKYEEFRMKYPVLFDLACSDDFDMTRFKYMMRLREEVNTNKRTLENASEEIGQKLFDVYVKDKVKPNTSS
ncbi:MAG: hypothetical protein EBU66_19980, partial [Bacteroidetes bacterium]|nr:hypothetical protein [Bacteroidota bacterium]